jgi:hypothetical protein
MIDTTDIAVPAGIDKSGRRLFRKGDSLLTEDELQADAEKLYASQVEDLELEQELGLVNRRTRSYDPKTLDVLRTFKAVDDDADSVDGVTADSAKLHLRALEILGQQGKADEYTADSTCWPSRRPRERPHDPRRQTACRLVRNTHRDDSGDQAGAMKDRSRRGLRCRIERCPFLLWVNSSERGRTRSKSTGRDPADAGWSSLSRSAFLL